MAYVSEESGSQQVYLTTWPDADQKLPVSLDGGMWPRWKGDGTELFFASGNDIFAVEVGCRAQIHPVQWLQPIFCKPIFLAPLMMSSNFGSQFSKAAM